MDRLFAEGESGHGSDASVHKSERIVQEADLIKCESIARLGLLDGLYVAVRPSQLASLPSISGYR